MLLDPNKALQRLRGELLVPLVYFFCLLVHVNEKAENAGEAIHGAAVGSSAPAGRWPTLHQRAQAVQIKIGGR